MSLTELAGRIKQEKTRGTEPISIVLLLCLSSAVCCVSGLSGPGAGVECPALLWVQFNSSCYTFIYVTQKNSLSIEPARELCKDIGTDIISINTQEENAFLLKMFQTQWKGPKEILLGMFYDSDDDSLKWFDKSEVTFSNWRPGQIANENLNTCVKMNTLSGLWDITDCDNFAESAVLCKTLYIPKKNRQNDQKAIMITLITAFTVIVLALPIVLLVLHKRNMLPYGFTSRHLQGASQIRPYSDDAILVDTMEREDYA